MKEICEKKNIAYNCSFTSNGLLIKSDHIPIFKNTQTTHFQITLDGDREFHNKVRFISDKKGSYDEIIKNIKLLLQNQISVTMRINYTAKNIESCKNIYEDIKGLSDTEKRFLKIDFHRVWQDKEGNAYKIMNETKRMFYNYGFNVGYNATTNAVINSCYADKKNSAVINYNGDLFKCTARDFNKKK